MTRAHGSVWMTCATPIPLFCKPKVFCHYATATTCFIGIIVFVHYPADVSSVRYIACSNKNRTIPTDAEAAAIRTPISPVKCGVLVSSTGTTLPLVLRVRQRHSRCRSTPTTTPNAPYMSNLMWREIGVPCNECSHLYYSNESWGIWSLIVIPGMFSIFEHYAWLN